MQYFNLIFQEGGLNCTHYWAITILCKTWLIMHWNIHHAHSSPNVHVLSKLFPRSTAWLVIHHTHSSVNVLRCAQEGGLGFHSAAFSEILETWLVNTWIFSQYSRYGIDRCMNIFMKLYIVLGHKVCKLKCTQESMKYCVTVTWAPQWSSVWSMGRSSMSDTRDTTCFW